VTLGRVLLARALHAVPVLLGVSAITFLLMVATPGDPIRLLAGDRATDEVVAALRARYGLDQPVWRQYLTYLGNLAQGDLGRSLRFRVPVGDLLAARYPVTLALVGMSVLISVPLTFALATLSARRQGGLADQAIRLLGTAGIALPVFWLAILMSRLFAVQLGWLPVAGWGETFGDRLRHLVLPALSTAIWVVPILTRNLRAALLQEMERDYVAAARARGTGEWEIFRRHVLPNSMLPVLNLAGVMLAALLGGSVIVETVYALPGMGSLMVESIFARDYYVVQGATLVFALTTVVVMLLTDLASAALDPRVSL
jgi:peptide/nickel transport system permease protein